MESVEISSNGLRHSLGTGSSKCYWMGADLNMLKCHLWSATGKSSGSTVVSLNLSKPLIPASLLRTACCTSSSTVMLMQNQSIVTHSSCFGEMEKKVENEVPPRKMSGHSHQYQQKT